jgi:hypothetical protein
MQNLNCVPINHIKRIFDLKGSRVERITKKTEKCDKRKTLKDLDYLWMIDIEEDVRISIYYENLPINYFIDD